jgi:acyl-coenzyme A thioesterase PaaI-like protein
MIKQTKEKVLARLLSSPTSIELKVLDKILSFMIPFNAPHGFKIHTLDKDQVSIELPYKKINFNHLKGIHACALVTLGEFCAGLSLIKFFSFEQYRPILKSIHSDFHYQAKTSVIGTILISHEQIENVKKRLETEEKVLVPLITTVTDRNQNKIATITTEWQIKKWEHVKTKI